MDEVKAVGVSREQRLTLKSENTLIATGNCAAAASLKSMRIFQRWLSELENPNGNADAFDFADNTRNRKPGTRPGRPDCRRKVQSCGVTEKK
ncbi:hypothetical protein KQX54_001560 [Cotesia glomerata]|uniref:Uncharacterized protein n=1 Tax=Cotesia glomerata TaxID=32391 RepID=A0AAV7J3A6_COTGL|nr:hypothetical protein KQX54_001560 [Cotesia glomerata]